MNSDDEVSRLYEDVEELKKVQEKRHRNRSPPDEKAIRKEQRKIFNTSPNPPKELSEKFAESIREEENDHDLKRKKAAKKGIIVSGLIPIPEPNSKKSNWGGMKRKTKRKSSMKKNKKSKKQKVKRKSRKPKRKQRKTRTRK
tara:strand:+ start:982 stop:1407 length:426 start_codon:yes stop_codon:yes gene_type:complete